MDAPRTPGAPAQLTGPEDRQARYQRGSTHSGRSSSFGKELWKKLNSGLFIAILSAVVAALLTDLYASKQAADSDRQARRTELAKLVVELDLRLARLKIARDQIAGAAVTESTLATTGSRAIAIVDGDPRTVISNPVFRGEHLVSLLSRAESASGVELTNKDYLLTFTDLNHCAAARHLAYLYARVHPLVYFLEDRLANGSLPQALDSSENAYQKKVYTAVVNSSTASAAHLDALGVASLDDHSRLCS